jgi:glycosyltransferase involved in cell wall biosynthesis
MTSRFSSAKVSVIIPNYNYGAYVGVAIQSVLDQTYRNIEIVVVNNGSSDNSLEVLSKFSDKIVLVDQINLGQAGARNSGIRKSTGDLIAFLDADDAWKPTKLERQISILNDRTQLVYCGLESFDSGSGNVLSKSSPKYRGSCVSNFLGNPSAAVVLGGESTALITRELLVKVGPFDSELNYSSGWDFFRRCSLETSFDFVPDSLTRYRIHGKNMSLVSKNRISDIRKSWFFMVKDHSNISGLRLIFMSFAKLEWSFVKDLMKSRSLSYLVCEILLIPGYFVKLLWVISSRSKDVI